MSRIDDLIREYCPDGVEFHILGDLCRIETGKLNANAAVHDGRYNFFTTAREISKIDNYRWNTEALLVAGNANVGDVKHFVGKFDAYQRTYVLTQFTPSIFPKFLFYVLKMDLQQFLEGRTNSAAMTYIVLDTLKQYRIPVPQLEVQREIVRILDEFTALEAELEAELGAELEARRKQYEHYKSDAFNFNQQATRVSLGEITEILQGFAFKSSMYSESGIRIVRISDVQKGSMSAKDLKYFPFSTEREVERYMLNVGDLVMSLSGSVGRVAMLSELDLPAALNQRVACIRPSTPRVSTRYLFHFLNTDRFEQEAIASTSGGTVKNLSSRWLSELSIPLPSIEVQNSVVSVLDKFDSLVNDISIGLPAEIAARRKQYEYYRDQLLTFKELTP